MKISSDPMYSKSSTKKIFCCRSGFCRVLNNKNQNGSLRGEADGRQQAERS